LKTENNIKIIFEDDTILVADKPSGIVVFPEGQTLIRGEKTLIDYLIEKYPGLKQAGEAPRYGIVHRLDKDTSGILLVAKTSEALIFLQNQFINRKVEKKYTALAVGSIKEEKGQIKTLIGRAKQDKRKQKAYPLDYPDKTGKREAETLFEVIKRFKEYTLLSVQIKTGRRHQIRCHLSFLQHPIAGDKLYGFKNQPMPEGLQRQFLHASYLKIQLPNGETKEFNSELPEDLQNILNKLK
jgi:23S rRNA pseudouridine1911/1915/1917 synthase